MASQELKKPQQVGRQSEHEIRMLRSLLRLKRACVPRLGFLELSPEIQSLGEMGENVLECHFLFPNDTF